jgi:hypothetical protein
MMVTEALFQFIWKYGLYPKGFLFTSCGQKLEIVDPGEQNPHAGPDFFNARIKMNQILWAGNVEIHRHASDWYKHGHHLDPAYNNVILHVVAVYDADVYNSLGRRIEALQIRLHENLIRRYELLKASEAWVPCGDYLHRVPLLRMKHWLHTLSKDRIRGKIQRMEKILYESGLDPEAALCRALAPGYGIPVNTLPFEMLIKKVPRPVLEEHRDHITDLEAILFGLSGMLYQARQMGTYPSMLWNRYLELKDSLPEKAVPLHMWRFLRLRPPSFPTLRISQFASLIYLRYPLSESVLHCHTINELEQFFRTGASEYWSTHYLFGKVSPPIPKYPGEQFIATLIINVLVPFLNSLDKLMLRSSGKMRASTIMENLKAENNQIIKKWSIFGVRATNAEESQALLQLYHVYCKQKRCLDCQIGAYLVITAIHEKEQY